MGYLPPTTIAKTLERIQRGDLILPAIQREYVWEPKQVLALFDSIMRGYPIGGFLSWKVEPTTVSQFRFYGFLKDYNEFDNRHCPKLDVPSQQPVTAMLDGQQRLTSLNIGLRGSYAHRVAGRWRTKKASFPVRRLHLNLLCDADENEDGLIHDFRLLTDKQVQDGKADKSKLWLPVSEIFTAKEMGDVWALARKYELGNDHAVQSRLSSLWEAVHKNQNLHFHEEEEQDVERVLDIFIRVNSGGTVLSYSDLLLSIATAQWQNRDAREVIHGLVDNLNSTGQGFKFSQDAVLKSGLVLAGIGDFAFRVKNFNAENMATLGKEWDKISESLGLAVDLLSDFGLSEATLPADSVVIPIAYYVHKRGLKQSYRTRSSDASDRAVLRLWTLRSLVMPGVWGSGLDTLLRDLREAIDLHGQAGFPAAEIEPRMAARSKSLVFGDEQIEDLLNLAYGRQRTFAIMAILFPHVDTRNVHHVDHVFPKTLFHKTRLKQQGVQDGEIERLQELRDQLPNLQLLEGPQNIAKSGEQPKAWADKRFPTPIELQNYLVRNDLPWLPSSATEFEAFFKDRRVRLALLIRATLSVGVAESVDPDSHVTAEAEGSG